MSVPFLYVLLPEGQISSARISGVSVPDAAFAWSSLFSPSLQNAVSIFSNGSVGSASAAGSGPSPVCAGSVRSRGRSFRAASSSAFLSSLSAFLISLICCTVVCSVTSSLSAGVTVSISWSLLYAKPRYASFISMLFPFFENSVLMSMKRLAAAAESPYSACANSSMLLYPSLRNAPLSLTCLR